MITGIAIINSTLTRAVAIVWPQQNTYTCEYDEGHKCDESSNDKFVKYAV